MKKSLLCAALLTAGALPLSAMAATSYSANITELNHSGVHGTANLLLDNNLLTFNLTAFGLEPNQTHVQHIHGLLDSNNMPLDSTSPTFAQDTDGDGFVELAEGLTTYGPILLQLTDHPAIRPMVSRPRLTARSITRRLSICPRKRNSAPRLHRSNYCHCSCAKLCCMA